MTAANVGYFLIGAAIMTAIAHHDAKMPYTAMFAGAIWILIGFYMYTASTYPPTGVWDVQYAAFYLFLFFGVMELFETGRITRKIYRDRQGRIAGTQEETEVEETSHDRDEAENVSERIENKDKELEGKFGKQTKKKNRILG